MVRIARMKRSFRCSRGSRNGFTSFSSTQYWAGGRQSPRVSSVMRLVNSRKEYTAQCMARFWGCVGIIAFIGLPGACLHSLGSGKHHEWWGCIVSSSSDKSNGISDRQCALEICVTSYVRQKLSHPPYLFKSNEQHSIRHQQAKAGGCIACNFRNSPLKPSYFLSASVIHRLSTPRVCYCKAR